MAVSVLVPGTSYRDAGQAATATLTSACGRAPGMACRLTWDITHSSYAADFASAYLAGPVRLALRIALVLLLAVLLRTAAQRVIRRLTARAAISRDRPDRPERPERPERPHAMFGERRSQRATALASVLGNAASVAIFSVAALIIVGDLGLNLAPILASAGVLGIALGFGAQSLVQDYLAGIFILLEDQYGVGDVIDVSSISGTVESVSLRITRVRDVNGVAWHIRNGTIQQAGNETHGWARAVVDFPVPYGTPVAIARAALREAAAGMYAEPRWNTAMLEQPEVWGVETVSSDTLLIRVVARTRPLARSEVARELRERLKDALDAAAAAEAPGPELATPAAALPAADSPSSPDADDAVTAQARTGHGSPAAAKPSRITIRRQAAADAAAGRAGAGSGPVRKPRARKTGSPHVLAEPSPDVPPQAGASPQAGTAADAGTQQVHDTQSEPEASQGMPGSVPAEGGSEGEQARAGADS